MPESYTLTSFNRIGLAQPMPVWGALDPSFLLPVLYGQLSPWAKR